MPTERLLPTKQQVSYTAVLSLILSGLSIPVVYMSFHEIESIHHLALYSCIIVTDSPVHTIMHNLCSILPTVSIVFGILALMRIRRSRGKLYGKYLAITGLVVSVVSLVVYGLLLVRLVSSAAA